MHLGRGLINPFSLAATRRYETSTGLSHLGLGQMPDLRPAYLSEVVGADVERMLVACFLHSRSVISWTSSSMSELKLHLHRCWFRWWSRGGVEAVSDTLRW